MEISTVNTYYPFKDAVLVFGDELFENVDFWTPPPLMKISYLRAQCSVLEIVYLRTV